MTLKLAPLAFNAFSVSSAVSANGFSPLTVNAMIDGRRASRCRSSFAASSTPAIICSLSGMTLPRCPMRPSAVRNSSPFFVKSCTLMACGCSTLIAYSRAPECRLDELTDRGLEPTRTRRRRRAETPASAPVAGLTASMARSFPPSFTVSSAAVKSVTWPPLPSTAEK